MRVWVGGLAPTVTQQDIETRLSLFGKVVEGSVEFIVKGEGVSQRFAYLTLETSEEQWHRCRTILHNSVYKGSRLQVAAARPTYSERLAAERERAAASATEERPRKQKNLWHSHMVGVFDPERQDLMTDKYLRSQREVKGWAKGRYGRAIALMHYTDSLGRRKVLLDPRNAQEHLVKLWGRPDYTTRSRMTWQYNDETRDYISFEAGPIVGDKYDKKHSDADVSDDIDASMSDGPGEAEPPATEEELRQERERNLHLLTVMFGSEPALPAERSDGPDLGKGARSVASSSDEPSPGEDLSGNGESPVESQSSTGSDSSRSSEQSATDSQSSYNEVAGFSEQPSAHEVDTSETSTTDIEKGPVAAAGAARADAANDATLKSLFGLSREPASSFALFSAPAADEELDGRYSATQSPPLQPTTPTLPTATFPEADNGVKIPLVLATSSSSIFNEPLFATHDGEHYEQMWHSNRLEWTRAWKKAMRSHARLTQRRKR